MIPNKVENVYSKWILKQTKTFKQLLLLLLLRLHAYSLFDLKYNQMTNYRFV